MSTNETPSALASNDANRNRQVADVLLAKYGKAAVVVAARQMDGAVGAQKDIWAAIVALLRTEAGSV